jgi:hypothetical protein
MRPTPRSARNWSQIKSSAASSTRNPLLKNTPACSSPLVLPPRPAARATAAASPTSPPIRAQFARRRLSAGGSVDSPASSSLTEIRDCRRSDQTIVASDTITPTAKPIAKLSGVM